MNKHDSERIAGVLKGSGFEAAQRVEEADVIVFNTCCVREHAENKLYGHVSRLKSLKQRNKSLTIAVGGCLAQREGIRIQEKAPYVDLVFGTHNLSRIGELVEEVRSKRSQVCELWEESEGFCGELPALRENAYQAWVPISIGCNNFCSYCVVPYVRGPEVSRNKEDILTEARKLAFDGVKEVTLLGQNVNSYGWDIYGKRELASLFLLMDKIKGIERIRFITSHPKDLSNEIMVAVADVHKVCEYIHLPIQAGSDRILQLMNREYTQQEYISLVEKIRERIPEVSISTDIIVGFPGEEEEDFQETLQVLKRVQFDQAFTFMFSPRLGTLAASMEGQVEKKVKKDRFKRLLETQHPITYKRNLSQVGKCLEVLVEGPSKKDTSVLTGRTRDNRIVNFRGEAELISQLVRITITKAYTWHLEGVPENGIRRPV